MAKLLAISHKYEIKYLWDWSLRVIKDHLSSIPGQLISSCGESWSEAERLLKLLDHSPDAAHIRQHIEEEWLKMIQSSDLTKARAAFTAALDAAERSPGLRQFHAKAYHTYVKAIGKARASTSVDMNNTTTFVDLTTSDLGELRTNRLCRGFWSLSQLRLKLSVAPKIDDNPSCINHAHLCVLGWVAWWKRNLQAHINDPEELIEAMRGRVGPNGITRTKKLKSDMWDDSTSMTSTLPCSEKILEQLTELTKGFQDTLGDHFMLPRE
jgi:hypothetical protein